MDVTIRGRNVEVSDALKAQVTEKVQKLSRFLDGMDHADIHFAEERNPRIAEKDVCEVVISGHGHLVRAKASAGDPFAAVDRVVDKLEHQIEKLKGKLIGRSHPRRHGSVNSVNHAEPDDAGPDEEELVSRTGPARIVKTKQFSIKPMTPEEAALQMDLLGHDFYFFTNADTEQAAVVYRRNDGNVGLIDATT
ncbi:MAG: ribosome-associated protein [Acidimicrobiales bacterium]|jgi:putative sigma-54 modulation protein|nr:ribosome-associated protein [Acidimicrobiales bacterium]